MDDVNVLITFYTIIGSTIIDLVLNDKNMRIM